MTGATRNIIIIATVVMAIVAGGLYFLYFFFSSFAPPDIKITKDYIKTNGDFINGVTIERISVDSIGDKGYPVKYTATYVTSCSIDHPAGRPPEPPDKIYFKKPGKYSWTEENVNIPFVHEGLGRKTRDSTRSYLGSMGREEFAVCPLTFQKQQWYYFTFLQPQITGIFFYINKEGQEHQYYLESGVSPI